MNRSVLDNIESIAAAGKAVMVGNFSTIEAIVKDAIENERTVSFYLTNAQAEAVRAWYWKPAWVAYTGLREISADEATNISSKLGLDNLKGFRFAAVQCTCGHTYGAFEFLEQGIREHGLEVSEGSVRAEEREIPAGEPVDGSGLSSVWPEVKARSWRHHVRGGNLCWLQLLRGPTREGLEGRRVVTD